MAKAKGHVRKIKGASLDKDEEADLLLSLVGSSPRAIPKVERGRTKGSPMSIDAFVQQGILEVRSEEGEGARMVDGPEAFGKVFLICDRAGRSADLLRTGYAQRVVDERLLLEASKGLIFTSIYTILRLLSSSNRELVEDPLLRDVSEELGQSQAAVAYLNEISKFLDEVGFGEMLRFSLEGSTMDDRESERQGLLKQMAERDIAMFFGPRPPMPSISQALLALLFPKDERDEILIALRSSPSAMRALLLAKDARSSALVSAALLQSLPMLARLFELFAIADADSCGVGTRKAWDDDIVKGAERWSRDLPRPSPLLAILQDRMRADAAGLQS